MKRQLKIWLVLTALLLFVNHHVAHAQFLKNVLNSVKQTSQNNTGNKVDQITNKALDKVENLGKKKSKGTTTSPTGSNMAAVADTTKTAGNNATAQNTTAGNNTNNAQPQNNPYNSDGSFISLNLSSDRIIATGAVLITGSSVKYKNFNSVNLTITTQDGTGKESRTLPLDTSGAYSTIWQLNSDGDYIVYAKSSDGKNTVSRRLGVFKPEDMDSVIKPLKTSITTASDKLEEDIDKAKSTLTGQDADALQKKMSDFTDKKDKVLKQLDDVAAAGKGLVNVEKKHGALPSSVLKNVSDMTDVIAGQTRQVEQAIEATDHAATDNSVCEYLVIVSEACAAFSTFVNFEGKFTKVLTNLAGDKAGRAVAGYSAKSMTGGSDAASQAAGECASLFVDAKTESDALEANFSPLSFGGDIVHMCSDLLLKKYCAVMSGELDHTYECTYRNKDNNVWWKYTYTTKAAISLRYPKNNAGGSTIKMKGNIEGNATKFTIFQDAQQIDAYKDAMKGREGLTQFYSICLHKPVAIPFSAASADKDVGFGAVARAIATPASFNIPIDADYDVAQKKVTIYANDALNDFTPAVCYIYGYISIAAGIPLVTRVNYPINSVKLTLGKVIRDNSHFNVNADAENNLMVNGTGKTKLGDASSATEQDINFSFKLKSDE
ncbi:MAG: hypothetical protein ABI863_13995 [Ginsengibacter sp.]